MDSEEQSGAPDERAGQDALDAALVVWAREIPDLEPVTEGIVERIGILSHALEESLEQTLAEYELDRRSFHVIGRLRSYGRPYQRSAGMLAKDMRLSSGAMTNRLDRMRRPVSSGGYRPIRSAGTLIEPTEAGHAAWDKSVSTQARREAMIASVLSPAERDQLHSLLRQLMRAFPDKVKKKFPSNPNRSSTVTGELDRRRLLRSGRTGSTRNPGSTPLPRRARHSC